MPIRPYIGTLNSSATSESQPTADGQVHAGIHVANMSVLATSLGMVISLSDENAKFAIYDHNSGDNEPENLLGYTGVVTNSAERASPVWTFGDLNVPVYLERGTTFWIAVLSEFGNGQTGSDSWMKFLGSGERFCRITTVDNWPTFPNPFGTPTFCADAAFPNFLAQLRGDLDVTPGPVARNKDADW